MKPVTYIYALIIWHYRFFARGLSVNKITVIPNGTFTGLTSLENLLVTLLH